MEKEEKRQQKVKRSSDGKMMKANQGSRQTTSGKSKFQHQQTAKVWLKLKRYTLGTQIGQQQGRET